MMILALTPQQGGAADSALFVAGDVLTVDGRAFDLSAVPEGGRAEAQGDHPFLGPIQRIGGVIHAPVRVLLGPTAEPHQNPDPAHWIVTAGDGPVTIPASRKPEKKEVKE